MAPNRFDGLISSFEMMLGSLNHERAKTSSISRVPEKVRRSKVEAYKPKVVSIGPLHRETSKDLLYMEEIKWRYMHSLLHRTENAKMKLQKCTQVILNLVDAIRATYLEEIKIESYELAKIMLLDGCFLLELLISSDRKWNKDLGSNFPVPGSGVGKSEEVLSDLKLLENQIPLFILDTLFKELFVKEEASQENPIQKIQKDVNECVSSLFGYDIPESQDSNVPKTAHILEHIHGLTTPKKNKKDQKNKHVVTIPEQDSLPETKLKLKYCATKLRVAGVTIEPPNPQSRSMQPPVLGCYKNLSNGRLEIQPLHITAKTEVELRNFIAWEQSRIIHRKFTEENTGCAFTEYVSLLKDLVCCEEDIKLLKTQRILTVNHEENLTNKDLMNFLRAIVDGIRIDAGGDFGNMIDNLNQNSTLRKCHRIFWHQFKGFLERSRYQCRNLYQTLKRDHTPTLWKTIGVLAAIVLLFLTVAQTVFAALGL